MSSYSLCARPNASHGYPYLVFDCQGELHLPLIVFAKEAQTRLAPSSVQKYLTNILPFFSWLDTDPWQLRAHHCWLDPPEVLRHVVREYLVSKLQCRVKEHPEGGEWLETTEEAVNAVRLLLAGLKLFYRIAKTHGYYQYTNPLSASFTETVEVARAHLVRDDDGSMRPQLPDKSGVDAPRREGRLTDSYFLLKEKWIPQVVTDIELPQKILNGGRILKEQGKVWGLREECLIVLLFETGARVSELMLLTLGDWNQRGLKETAWTRNKGSRKRRARNLAITKYYGRPNQRLIAERSHGLMTQISSSIDVDDLILRSPEELRELLKKAQKTHGTLARTRGGRCMLSGECPILFACIGCSAKVPDPAQRGEVEEVRQVTLIQIDRAKKKGLTLEVMQYQKKLRQCDAELKEMDMMEACREDEQREPEVNFEIDA